MAQQKGDMAKSRGLITDTERERIANETDVDDQKRYQAISRVRRRIREELPEDLKLLRENKPELAQELEEAVCGEAIRGESSLVSKIETWQQATIARDPAEAKVLVVPVGEPGYFLIDVEADPDTHPAPFFLRLAAKVEDALDETEAYDGRPAVKGRAGIFLEDVAEQLFVDFDREDL